jgi:hypothetical protein
MAQLQTEVKTSSLPQAFQDAVTIAHHLGIYYLWIDALCIKQDKDNLDWNIESQNMDKVYSNAFLNLSATAAPTGTEPLLRETCISTLEPSKIDLFDSAHNQYSVIDGGIWKDEIDDAPLSQRGWVYQERFLARRILHCGPRQLAWECHEMEALEMFPNKLYQFSTLLCMSKPRAYKELRQSQRLNVVGTSKFVDEYHLLVHNYSKCNLTFSKDKLIAFSGILKSIQEIRGDFYVAGVWNRSLPFDLSWHPEELQQHSIPARQASFRAPSWSWASVTGAVKFPRIPSAGLKVLIANWTFVQPRIPRKDSVHRTSIKLEGFLFPLQIEWLDDGFSGFQIFELHFDEEHESNAPEGAILDLDGPDEDVLRLEKKGNIYWMPLFATKHEICGIIVGRVYSYSNFRRFGTLQIPLLKRLEEVEKVRVQNSNDGTRITRGSKRKFSDALGNETSKQDRRGQSLIEAMKVKQSVDIILE